MSSKKWITLPSPPNDFVEKHPELPPTITRLLWNRNLRTQSDIDEFLNPDYSADLHDPFLFNDMPIATDMIFSAIADQKNIVVHGDYDADGVSAAAILITTLRRFGAENVSVFIPHREIDGYGLNENTVKLFQKEKIDLIITCDCGISNFPEIKLVKELGMKIIITDHHSIPEIIPPADAIIHPKMPNEKYPDKGLAGAAVAFKLVQGLLKKHKENNSKLPSGESHEAYEKWLLDMVAIATIGDMVPLVGESRTLTRYGLTVLNKTRNYGLQQLFIAAGIGDENGNPKHGAYDAETVGFQIVPRLNAAGRMDHANTAYALLMAESEKEGHKLAEKLNKNNTDRQKLTEKIMNEAKKQIAEQNQADNPIIFVIGEDWPTGVLGLVSGRLKDQFNKPAIAMGMAKGTIFGSGRSIVAFNLIAGLQSMPQFFDKFGGHPQACGFNLKNKELLEDFKKTLSALVAKETKDIIMEPEILIDAQVDLEDVDWKLYDLLQKFEPFGQANEEPKYAAYGLTVFEVNPIGQDGRHLKIMVKHNSHIIRKTIAFGLGDENRHPEKWKTTLKPGDKIDIVFSVSVNQWNGNRELELKIEDIKKEAR